MLNKNISVVLLLTGLSALSPLAAKAAYINTLEQFYDSYDNYHFSQEQKAILEETFNVASPFLGENGKQNLINAGYIPFLSPVTSSRHRP